MREVSRLFMYGTSLEGMEQLMVMVPNFKPKRSGIVIKNYFNCQGDVKDCNCNDINTNKDWNKCGYKCGYIGLDLNITIKESSDDNNRKTIWLPMEEDKLEEVCKELGIEMTTEKKAAWIKDFQIYWLIKM